jgi:predicted RNase H-like HicB family nuclease
MERKFTMEYWLDDNWYVGRIKEVPGVFSQGETLAELEQNIVDAYRMVISEEESGYSPSSEIQYKEVTVTM